MELITERMIIKGIPRKWNNQYQHQIKKQVNPDDFNKKEIYKNLLDLDLENCTAKDVELIIGNGSWARLTCRECNKDVIEAVAIAGTAEYGPEEVCIKCLRGAVKLIMGSPLPETDQ